MSIVTKEEKDWLNNLLDYLKIIISPIVGRDNVKKYFTVRTLPIWVNAFTHESKSPIHNYEKLEFLGDGVLKLAFVEYLMKRFPDFDKNDYTSLNSYYMNHDQQCRLSIEMGLSKYVRKFNVDHSVLKVDADVFESFFGALYQVSDIVSPSSGYPICYNMIAHIFSRIEILPEARKGHQKTRVSQIMERLGVGKPREEVSSTTTSPSSQQTENDLSPSSPSSSSSHRQHPRHHHHHQVYSVIEVVLDDNQLSELKTNYKLDLPRVIGKGTSTTKRSASDLAYKNALDFLLSKGMNEEWAEQERMKNDFISPGVDLYLDMAMKKLRDEGYDSMYFFIPRKMSTNLVTVVQLIGKKSAENKHVVLSTSVLPRDKTMESKYTFILGKANAIKLYATGEGDPSSLPLSLLKSDDRMVDDDDESPSFPSPSISTMRKMDIVPPSLSSPSYISLSSN